MAGTVRESKTILTAEDKTGGAFASLQKKLDETTAKLTDFSSHWKAIAGGLTVGAFATMIKNSIDAMDAMSDLGQEAGITAEALSRFEEPAKLAGMSLGDVTSAIQKMSKSMIAAKDPASSAAQALAAFGLSIKDVIGLSPSAAFEKIAKASTLYGNSIEKNAALMELFGKTGASLQKLFAEMANKGELAATVTDEQAEAAARLNDSLDKLHMRSELWRRSVANELIPSLQKTVDVFAELSAKKNEAGGFFEFIGGVVRFAGFIVAGFALTIKDLGDQIGFLAAKAAALTTVKVERAANGGITGFQLGDTAALKDLDEGRAKQFAAYEAALAKLHATLKTGKADVGEEADNWDKMGKAVAKFNPEISKADDEYKKLLLTINEKIKSAEQEAGIGRKLSDGEKLLFEILSNKYEKLLPWQAQSAADKARELIADEKLVALRKADLELLKLEIDAEQQLTAAMGAQKRAADDLIGSYVQRNKDLEFEMTLIGKSADEVDRLRIAEQTRRDALKATNETQRKLIESQGELYLKNTERLQVMKAEASLWDDLSGRAGNFFSDLVMNGKSAFDRLRQSLKQLFADMLALFAKKWILSIAGDPTAAAAAGAGTTTGSLLSKFGPGGSGLLGTAGMFAAVAAGGYGLGSYGAGALGAGERGQKVGGITGLLGGGLLGAIIGKFTDPNGLANRTADFGGGRSNYWWGGGQSAFGSFGITNDKWFSDADMLDKVKTFQSGLANAENALAKYLTSDQIANVTKALANSKNYSFGTEHGDFAGTLGQILKDRIDTIIAAVDPSLKKWLDGFTGTGDELAAYAESLLQVNQALGSDQVKGLLAQIPELTIDGLMKMKTAGESLSDTFQRVVGEFITAQNNLNAAIGARNPAFARDLVLGQRNNIGTQFAQLIGQQYGADLATRMALNPQSFTGLSTEGMNLLTQWLSLQTTLEQLDAQLSGGTTDAISNFTDTVINSTNAMGSAVAGLAGYLRGSLLSDLSPLSPAARYAEAKKQFNANLTLAQGGNVDAISNFGSVRDQFLQASRAVYASSGQYNTDFFSSYNAGAALTNGAVRPYTAADATLNTQSIVAAIAATASGQQVTNTILVDYLNELAQGNTSQNSSKIVELLGMLNDRVRINGGALTSGNQALA